MESETRNKRQIVAEWRETHPGGTQRECIEETGISKSYVSKIWNKDVKREPEGRAVDADRVTLILSPEQKRRLKLMAADTGQTITQMVSGWLDSEWHKWSKTFKL